MNCSTDAKKANTLKSYSGIIQPLPTLLDPAEGKAVELFNGVERLIEDPLSAYYSRGDFEMLYRDLGYGHMCSSAISISPGYFFFAERERLTAFTRRWPAHARYSLCGERKRELWIASEADARRVFAELSAATSSDDARFSAWRADQIIEQLHRIIELARWV